MDLCLLCLENNKDILDSIESNSSQWQNLNITTILEKYFWPLDEVQNNSWICLRCWETVKDFHNFHRRIEQAHLNFDKIKLEVCEGDLKDSKENVTKEESEAVIPDEDTEIDKVSNVVPVKDENVICLENTMEITENLGGHQNDLLNNDPLEKLQCFKAKKRKNIKVKLKSKAKTPTGILEKQEKKENPPLDKEIKELTNNVSDSKETNDTSDNNDSEYLSIDDDTSKTTQLPNNTLENPKFDEFTSWQEKDAFIGQHFKNILCDLCQTPLENFSLLKKHFQTVHNRCGYIICCNRKLSAHSIVIDHIRWHMYPEYFKCLECGKVMLDRRNLKIHKQNVHRQSRKITVRPCKICGKVFDQIDLLRKHKLTHTEEEEKNEKGKYPCTQCGKFYRQAHLLKRHNDVVHLKKHARICDICGKSCSTTTDYKMHRRIHEPNPTIIKCDVCGIRLVSERNLKIHKKHQHPEGGLQEHPCPQCDKVAHTAVALRRHIYYMHENGVNCKCSVCGKTFKKSKILREHMALHTGDTLYKCAWCPKTFNSSANMGVHRRKYHLKEWEEEKLKREMK